MANILMPAIVVNDGKIPGGTINAGTSAVTAVTSGYHNVQSDLILPAVSQTSLSASNIVAGAEVTIKTGDNILFSIIGSATSGGNDVIVELPMIRRESGGKTYYSSDYHSSSYATFYLSIDPSEFEGVKPRGVYAMPVEGDQSSDFDWWVGGVCMQAYNEVFTGGQFTHPIGAQSYIDTTNSTNDWMKMNRTDGIIIPVGPYPSGQSSRYYYDYSRCYRVFIIGEAV